MVMSPWVQRQVSGDAPLKVLGERILADGAHGELAQRCSVGHSQTFEDLLWRFDAVTSRITSLIYHYLVCTFSALGGGVIRLPNTKQSELLTKTRQTPPLPLEIRNT